MYNFECRADSGDVIAEVTSADERLVDAVKALAAAALSKAQQEASAAAAAETAAQEEEAARAAAERGIDR